MNELFDINYLCYLVYKRNQVNKERLALYCKRSYYNRLNREKKVSGRCLNHLEIDNNIEKIKYEMYKFKHALKFLNSLLNTKFTFNTIDMIQSIIDLKTNTVLNSQTIRHVYEQYLIDNMLLKE
jgi:hypothetical protein